MNDNKKSKEQLLRELAELRSENNFLKMQAAKESRVEADFSDRRKVDSTPAAEWTLLRTLVDMLPSYIYVKDHKLQFILANTACATYMGASSSLELLGKTDADFYPASEAAIFRSEEMKVLEGIPMINVEDIRVLSGGQRQILLTTKVPLRNNDGKIIGLVGTSLDITERKTAEDKLRSSEERLKIIFDYAPDAYFLTDLHGTFIDGNIAAEKLLGQDKKDLIGKNYLKINLISLKYLPKAAKLLIKNSLGLPTGPDDFTLCRKDGSEVVVEVITYPVKIKGNTLILGLARDITERKIVEKAILKNEADLKAIIENSSESIWSIDTSYKIQYVNDVFVKAFRQTFGKDLSKGVNVLELLPPSLRSIWKERYDRALRNEHFSFNDRIDVGNISVYIEVSMNPIVVNGQVVGASFYGKDISERMKADEKLRASEAQFRSLFESAADAIFIADSDTGIILDANQSASALMLLPIDEIKGLHQSQLHPVEIESVSKNSFLQHQEELVNKNLSNPIVNRVIRSDGSEVLVEVVASEVMFEGKKCLMGLFRDITKRKKAEEQLQQTKQTYLDIFNTLTEAIYILDETGTFIEVNRGAEIMYGYPREVLIGQSPATVAAPGLNNMEEIRKLMADVSVTGIPTNFEFWAKRNTGEIFPKDVIVNKGKYFEKDVLIATARDITLRKRDENANQLLYDIARSSSGVTILEDLFTELKSKLNKVIDTTNFFVALYSHETDTFRTVFFSDEKDDYEEWKAADSLSWQVVKSGGALLMNKDQLNQFAIDHSTNILGTISECWLGVPLIINQKPVGVIVVQNYYDPDAYDHRSVRLMELIAHELETVIERTNMINDLITAKEKAEESERLKSAFLANMSHEIRTPMNGILGFLALLNEPNLTEETKKEYIDVVSKSGERLLETINAIIEMSKIDSGESEVRHEEVNIAEIMEFNNRFFKIQADRKGLKLNLSRQITGSSAIIRSDRQKIDGILINLLRNAIKFTTSGTIEFGNYIESNSLVFFVKDSGRGIPSNRVEVIFNRFVQADLNLTRAHDGSGLGLAIAKGYVEALDGRIWVESEPGKGSTFSFSIPYTTTHLTSEPAITEVKKQKKTLNGLTILVAEDDEASYRFLEMVLEKEGVCVLHTVNGEETIRVFQENPVISLVLMDIKMPGIDGFEATSILKKMRPLIPVIAQTAFAFESDRENALRSGCIDFISKPVKRDILIEMIKKYITE